MAYRPIASDIEEYDDEGMGADVGYYDSQQRTPPSTRRQTVERPVAPATSRLRSAQQGAPATRPVTVEVDTVSPTARRRGNEVLYASSQRRRSTTGNDPQVTTRLQAVDPASLRAPKMTRRTLLIRAGVILGSFASGGLVLNWGASGVADIRQQMIEGAIPDKSIELVCGHSDSKTHPTQLHAFLLKNNTLSLVEYPGGDATKEHVFRSDPISAPGPLSKWYVDIQPLIVDGKYQIQLSVTVPGNGPFAQPVKDFWTFVDSGKGYFREAKLK